MKHVETVIIGQGLAGTAIAWTLANRGRDFCLIDDGNLHSSSQIAAGLVTPITGARHVQSWGWETAYLIAKEFYQNCESLTKTHFWKVEPAIRFFVSKEENERFENRYMSDSITNCSSGLVGSTDQFRKELDQSSWSTVIDASYGGFVMPEAARLMTAEFLKASRGYFESIESVCTAKIFPSTDIVIENEEVIIESADIRCKQVVFCEGHSALKSPWFHPIEIVPAQGDILTVRIPGLRLDRVLHAGFWIAPVSIESVLNKSVGITSKDDDFLYHVGSTYRWSPLNGVPNEESRVILSDKLRSLVRLPFEVVNHRAAIRPAGFDHKPLLGNHPNHPNLWILNGIGAKGVLHAPWCAEMLINAMLLQHPIDTDLAWNRKRKRNG